jgi:uncharacterized RDD family membrane protein YckC
MKCPKCDYLGFETGDRCKNCGYDFSLMGASVSPEELAFQAETEPTPSAGEIWLNRGDRSPEIVDAPLAEPRIEASFPLFGADDGSDEPLIKLPAEPRPPLAVRRQVETPRSRVPAKPAKRDAGLTLEFADEASLAPELPAVPEPPARPSTRPSEATSRVRDDSPVASLMSRALAALIDHGILLGIDLFVVYATLRMTALTMDEWRALPRAPLLAFLMLLKLSYFSSFTAMGGQTIGKMAAGIRVVADEPLKMDPARALGRSLTGALTLLSLGLGLIPAFVGADRRTLHDRLTHTRVVSLTSA